MGIREVSFTNLPLQRICLCPDFQKRSDERFIKGEFEKANGGNGKVCSSGVRGVDNRTRCRFEGRPEISSSQIFIEYGRCGPRCVAFVPRQANKSLSKQNPFYIQGDASIKYDVGPNGLRSKQTAVFSCLPPHEFKYSF